MPKDYKKFCELSLEKISMILEKVPSFKIDKIIYTSSASVYRIPENLNNQENKYMLLDEPTANLDTSSTSNLLDIMNKLNKNEKITFIFSTHDQRVIDRARRVITLEDGKIVSDKKK